MRDRRERGFTLMEILVVVVIVGILATIVIINVAGKDDEAKRTATIAKIRQVADAIQMFKMDQNRLPERLEELRQRPSDAKRWPPGGYLQDEPNDGWGRPFLYRKASSFELGYELQSYGADNRPGGEGVNEDITWPLKK